MNDTASRLVGITRELSDRLDGLTFSSPVDRVYNPLDYARQPHEQYLRRYARRGVEAVLIGMNPGPWGMAQTGVPFGEVSLVRDWLAIDGEVLRPATEHPKKPVSGFACRRSEVSGRRLWGTIRARFDTPDRFFSGFFVLNYCPLLFVGPSGGNLTPDKLARAEREPLLAECNQGLRRMIKELEPTMVIGVGGFAEEQARTALAGLPLRFGRILHPSPANPAANRDWEGTVIKQLAELGICW